ncbi:MAG: 3-dehydroquinate synthase [Firmicutes bacterium ADurb.Bin300]|nr:MAG: 3-dehydroquinate synthase [Firmicutes bacterium ADurb.Bin300]
MKTVRIDTPSRSYPVHIADNMLDRAGELAAEHVGICKAAIITDNIVDGLYADKLENSLRKSGFDTVKFVIPSGEKSKNAENFLLILNFLAENGLSRPDAVFALGGGVVGDIAGFAACVYLRGIKLVQIPTTLLAMIDSSVGGKTAIDLSSGKNLAGAFYQPNIVICDCSALETLDYEQRANGFAEIIKYAVICDKELFEGLKVPKSLDISDIILRCVEIKRDIVTADERDTGRRQILNFGHTLGHAIEKLSGFTLAHGKAVSIGMAIITKACENAGICENSCYNELVQMLNRYSLPSKTSHTQESLFNAAISDKKRKGEKITLVLPEKIGRCFLKTMSLSEMREIIKLGI